MSEQEHKSVLGSVYSLAFIRRVRLDGVLRANIKLRVISSSSSSLSDLGVEDLSLRAEGLSEVEGLTNCLN